MTVETASYISQLNNALPAAGDAVGEGDDHLKLIKSVLQTQFPNLTAGAVNTTQTEMNLLDGLTTLVQEGTAVLSTGETGAAKFLREDGDNTSSWQVPTDTNTTYTAGDGLDLTGTAFSTDLVSNGGLEIQSTELSVSQGISQYDVAQFAASVADNDFLKIATTSVEGRSASEVLSDIAALPLAGGAMTGAITTNSTFDGIDVATRDAVLTSTTTTAGAALPKAGGTMSGETIFADELATRPVIKDYAETVSAGGDTSTAQTLDETNGNVQTFTMTGNCTFTMPSGSGLQPGTSMTLILTQDGTGSRTGAFTSVLWAGGTAATLTTTATTGIDILTFYTFNGGASPVWYGFAAGLAMA